MPNPDDRDMPNPNDRNLGMPLLPANSSASRDRIFNYIDDTIINGGGLENLENKEGQIYDWIVRLLRCTEDDQSQAMLERIAKFNDKYPFVEYLRSERRGSIFGDLNKSIDSVSALLSIGNIEIPKELLKTDEFKDLIGNLDYEKKTEFILDAAVFGDEDFVADCLRIPSITQHISTNVDIIFSALDALEDIPGGKSVELLVLVSASLNVKSRSVNSRRWDWGEVSQMRDLLKVEGGWPIYKKILDTLDEHQRLFPLLNIATWTKDLADYVFAEFDRQLPKYEEWIYQDSSSYFWAVVLLLRVANMDAKYTDDYLGSLERLIKLNQVCPIVPIMKHTRSVRDIYCLLYILHNNIIEFNSDDKQRIKTLIKQCSDDDMSQLFNMIISNNSIGMITALQKTTGFALESKNNVLLRMSIRSDNYDQFKIYFSFNAVRKKLDLETVNMCLLSNNAEISHAMREYLGLPDKVKRLEDYQFIVSDDVHVKGLQIYIANLLYKENLMQKQPHLREDNKESVMMSGDEVKAKTLEIKEYISENNIVVPELQAAIKQARDYILTQIYTDTSSEEMKLYIEKNKLDLINNPVGTVNLLSNFESGTDLIDAWRYIIYYERFIADTDRKPIDNAELQNGEDIPWNDFVKCRQYASNLLRYAVALINDCDALEITDDKNVLETTDDKNVKADFIQNFVWQLSDNMTSNRGRVNEDGTTANERSCINGVIGRTIHSIKSHPAFSPENSQHANVKHIVDILILNTIKDIFKQIAAKQHLTREDRLQRMGAVYEACCSLGVDNAQEAMEAGTINGVLSGKEVTEKMIKMRNEIITKQYPTAKDFKLSVEYQIIDIVSLNFNQLDELDVLYIWLRHLAITQDDNTRNAVKQEFDKQKAVLAAEIKMLQPAIRALGFYKTHDPNNTAMHAGAINKLKNALKTTDAEGLPTDFAQHVSARLRAMAELKKLTLNDSDVIKCVQGIADMVFTNRNNIANLDTELETRLIPGNFKQYFERGAKTKKPR